MAEYDVWAPDSDAWASEMTDAASLRPGGREQHRAGIVSRNRYAPADPGCGTA